MELKYKYDYYISGKVTGMDRNIAVSLFEFVELEYKEKGTVYNPVKHFNESDNWYMCMFYCIIALMQSRTILFLSTYKWSRGARIEHFISKLLRKEIKYV